MRYLYTILFFLGIMSSASAGALASRDSSIYVVRGNMQRLQDELIISFDLSVERDLKANESVILEPIVVDGLGKEISLPKIFINSRRQHIMVQRGLYDDVDTSNSLLRERGTRQSYHYLESLPYSDWMESAKLIVNEESCGCGLPLASAIAFSADITTPYSLPAELPQLATVMPEETTLKLRNAEGSAYIIFPLNKTEVKPALWNNQRELDKITNSIDLIKSDSNFMVTNIQIHGYASPEGPYKINEKLSRGRSKAIKEYVEDIYDFAPNIIEAKSTAEDWAGFRALLEESTYKYKSEILEIIDSNIAPDKKEQKIRKDYPQFFQMLLDDWFIQLRHTDYVIEYEICFFNSVEEIEKIYYSTTSSLSLNELYQLAEYYANDNAMREEIFMKSVALYPEDPIANLNAACVALRRRDVAAAKRYLDLSAECGEKDLALGVYYLLTEKYDMAGEYLNKAEKQGVSQSQEYLTIYRALTQNN